MMKSQYGQNMMKSDFLNITNRKPNSWA